MILGHEKIIEELKRLAKSERLTHGYLFYGPEGVGKQKIARAFAHFLELGEFDDPEHAKILGDALFIAPDDAGTIGIDAVREIKSFLWQAPNKSARKMVVIDGSESLTGEAQNALLKVTEEPPASSLLILIARDPESLHTTLASRLTRIYFSTLPVSLIQDWLKERMKIADREAGAAALRSFGRPGFALRLLEDKKLLKNLELAERAFHESASGRIRVKDIIDTKNFNFLEFLDVLIFVAAGDFQKNKKRIGFWHNLLLLRREADHLNLNPRIQLENLFTVR